MADLDGKVFETVEDFTAVVSWMKKIDKKLEDLPEFKDMIAILTATQRDLAQSVKSFSETFKRATDQAIESDKRHKETEERYVELIQSIIDKDKVPADHVPLATVNAIVSSQNKVYTRIIFGFVTVILMIAGWAVREEVLEKVEENESRIEKTEEVVEKAAEVLKLKELNGTE